MKAGSSPCSYPSGRPHLPAGCSTTWCSRNSSRPPGARRTRRSPHRSAPSPNAPSRSPSIRSVDARTSGSFAQWARAVRVSGAWQTGAVDALTKQTSGPGLALTQVPEPEVGINDVLIRVDRTGICGTDLHIADWNEWAQHAVIPPLVVGHEFVGEVVSVGSNVRNFNPGELVSGEGHVVCGRCMNCL